MGSQDIRDAACGQPDELLLSAGVVADMVRRAAILVATVLAALTLSVAAQAQTSAGGTCGARGELTVAEPAAAGGGGQRRCSRVATSRSGGSRAA